MDVFVNPQNVTEKSEIDEENLHAYGLNRLALEKFVRDQYSDSLIVRLPGLVGSRLKKNGHF